MSQKPLLPNDAGDDHGDGDDDNTKNGRIIKIMDPDPVASAAFCDNSVVTSKYTLIPWDVTFHSDRMLPTLNFVVFKNLYEQFCKAANLYFLFIGSMQVIPGISPTGRFTTLGPLLLVLFVSMCKDAYEDYKRHQLDREVNNRMAEVFRNGQWVSVMWHTIKVGDLVKVSKGQPFPADLCVLWTSELDGICYIETASLDGETNLKIRKATPHTYAAFKPREAGSFSGTIVCETPNDRLYTFDGYLERRDNYNKPVRTALSNDAILLRGAKLMNTKELYAVVVFTGKDTKLMQNSSSKHFKMSKMDHITNRQIGFVLAFQICLCLICAVGLGITTARMKTHWYLQSLDDSPGLKAALGFLTFLILFNNLIPISLYVSLEIVKLFQASLINSDIEIYHDKTDTPALARTSALNEELGQVEYIFSDKTGTLTCNIMDFLKFSCSKVSPTGEEIVAYGTGNTEIGRAAAIREGREIKDDRPADYKPMDGFYFYDARVSNQAWRKAENYEQINFLLQVLAVCHTVIPERNEKTRELVYQASSPDESCLVKGAKELGVMFIERTDSTATIDNGGVREVWDILNVIEFNSTRKRMSIICRDPRKRLMLLTKGADTVIYERLKKDPSKQRAYDETLSILTRFAADGLRTLVLAMCYLEDTQYKAWAKRYEAASMAITDRADKMANIAEDIEKDLELVGTTAIEDKLQGEVPLTIELLAAAGIKIWVLTGDKQETAINIGFACSLLSNDMGLFVFDECTEKTILKALEKYVHDAEQASIEEGQDLGLVIQGDMLAAVLPVKDVPFSHDVESKLFLSLATRCKAVICCRVSPLQKAQVVQLVRGASQTVSLAIGDGANDVSMIQAAHVGIGISGLEGLQAARSSDYSIAQFRFLQRLLLVHGRWNYRRIAKLIVYSFYKNITMYLTQFWFCFFNSFTGQSLYDPWSLSLYNVLFAAYPVMALAVLDRDVESKRVLSTMQFPELYQQGLKNTLFNTVVFWKYTSNAVYHSICAFFIPMICYKAVVDPTTGATFGLPGQGILGYTSVLIIVTIKVGLETSKWTVVNFIFTFGSVAIWFLFLFVYGSAFGFSKRNDFAVWYKLPHMFVPLAQFWLIVIVTVVFATTRDLVWKFWKRNYLPDLYHKIQQWEVSWEQKRAEFVSKGRIASVDKPDVFFDREDVKMDVPRLFPRQELKKFTPDLTKGVGHHRFRGGGGAVGFLERHTGFAFSSTPGQADAMKSSGGGGVGSGLVRGPDGTFFSKQRKTRITEIIDAGPSSDIEMQKRENLL